MRTTAFFFLTVSFLGSFGSCKTRFISPLDWRDDERNRRDPEKNRRYVVGETIPLKWENDINGLGLWLVQVVGSKFQFFGLDSSSTSWEAKYDEWGIVGNGEDTVYFFELSAGEPLASSLYFNVTAPKNDNTRTVTISQSLSLAPERSSTAISTTTEEIASPSKEQDIKSNPGMSQGAVAGAAVGGVIGSLVIFGVVGWVLWRRMAKRKSDSVNTTAIHYERHAVETKAELPGDNRVHPSEYARSPTGIYEAP